MTDETHIPDIHPEEQTDQSGLFFPADTQKSESTNNQPDNSDFFDQVPEDGQYKINAPDGMEIDDELAGALSQDFKTFGLSHKQAQKLADSYAEIQLKRAETQSRQWGETLESWVNQAKTDKNIGGTHWNTTVSDSRRAIEHLGTPALKQYLNASGGGNHPELIRFMAKVGAMIKEDNPASGDGSARSRPADPAHILFPNDAPKG